MSRSVFIGFTLGVIFFLAACGGSQQNNKEKQEKFTVNVHTLSDPKMLNPYNTADLYSQEIRTNIFQTLLAVSFRSLEMVPVLAKDRPKIETTEQGGLELTYHIRPEAEWDNGTPVTAKDVAFSMKVIKNPRVNCDYLRPYFEFVDSVVLYDQQPRKVKFVCGEKYLRAEATTGIYEIIPRYKYDPDGLMDSFTVAELDRRGQQLADHPKVKKFAQQFNAEKYQRKKGYIEGSGPYEFKKWKSGQRVVLQRNQNWWGDKFETPPNVYFEAYPDKIVYKTINDQQTALVALKNGKIDVMKGIPPKDFIELSESEKFSNNFNRHTESALVYYYLGINMKRPKFKNPKVRQAIAHLVDVPQLIDKVYHGLAENIIGPVHPSRGSAYNDTITPYKFNLSKAEQLLKEAGWHDSNNDGVVDKRIQGNRKEMKIKFIYNAGNTQRKNIGLIFQEAAQQVGVDVQVTPQEASVFINNLKKHNFDMCCRAWSASPIPSDPKQIWHSRSYQQGSNYVGFGTAESDSIIEQIRQTLNDKKRAALYRRLQEIIHREVPYVFLFAPKARIAIHKRFKNADPSVLRPGYWAAGFKLKKASPTSSQAGF